MKACRVDGSRQGTETSNSTQAGRILMTQLPPTRFWAWLLQGGFSLLDAVLVLVWSGIMAVISYTLYDSYMKYCWTTFNGVSLSPLV